jgi:hypothetical protein
MKRFGQKWKPRSPSALNEVAHQCRGRLCRPCGAVLMPSERLRPAQPALLYSAQLQSILEAARKRFREGRGIPHEAFWSEVEAEKPKRTK